MAISLKTHKMLWGRAANRCSICRLELVMDATQTDDESLVGEECHMVAKTADGPRGQSSLPLEARDFYANLILLCRIHHKLVDDQPNTYAVEKLATIKAEHETWVRCQLTFDAQKQNDDEIYATYVETWVEGVELDDWIGWASSLLSDGQPSISEEMKDRLDKMRTWLLGRVWPGRYPALENAFTNFGIVLQDFCFVFRKHAEKAGSRGWETKKFYHIDRYDPKLYGELSDEFDKHVDLVQDLALELTRAANYVCDAIRTHLVPTFRLKEGVLLIQGGPYSGLTYKTYRTEYQKAERTARPYPGLDAFLTVRLTRDFGLGGGQ
jgi:hypothetical protein